MTVRVTMYVSPWPDRWLLVRHWRRSECAATKYMDIYDVCLRVVVAAMMLIFNWNPRLVSVRVDA